jgi:hypothetical protein
MYIIRYKLIKVKRGLWRWKRGEEARAPNALVKVHQHGKRELQMALGEWDFSEWK